MEEECTRMGRRVRRMRIPEGLVNEGDGNRDTAGVKGVTNH